MYYYIFTVTVTLIEPFYSPKAKPAKSVAVIKRNSKKKKSISPPTSSSHTATLIDDADALTDEDADDLNQISDPDLVPALKAFLLPEHHDQIHRFVSRKYTLTPLLTNFLVKFCPIFIRCSGYR